MTRYALIGLVALLALAGVKIYFLSGEVSELKLAAERLDKQHQKELIDKLAAEKSAFDAALKTEHDRRLALEARNHELLKQVAQIKDYGDRLAESLRIVLNSLFSDPPAEARWPLPAARLLPAHDRTPTRQDLTAKLHER